MADVIKVEHVSKLYRLGVIGATSITDDLKRWSARMRGKEDPFLKIGEKNDWEAIGGDYVWALKDVDFQVQQGEVLGIIGKNGAGKSTLLKILSRVTTPTSGVLKVRGRIASLLEVGTGFHPELTGKENIFLNGAIMGMSKSEIKSRFDEIVDFSGVERYINTPVKRYSSGMYVRLAFAVAAHLEPEILIIDEVLAVGDFEFQKRCLGKMGEVSRSGRTVLFVSHRMSSINDLCTRCINIEKGEVVADGNPKQVIDGYLSSAYKAADTAKITFELDRKKEFQVLSACLVNENGDIVQNFNCDENVILQLECIAHKPIPSLQGYLSIDKKDGTVVMMSDSYDSSPNPFDNLSPGKYKFHVTIPKRTLAPDNYVVYLSFTSMQSMKSFHVDSPKNILTFHIDDTHSKRGNERPGFFSTMLQWDEVDRSNIV